MHFQQVLNNFGFFSVYYFLKNAPPKPRVVVTVHEIDPVQNEFPQFNKIYNRADKIIVHFEDMKRYLTSHGVDERKVEIIHNGTDIPELHSYERQGMILHGGSHLTSGKGLDALFSAMKILKDKNLTLILKIYGYFSETDREVATRMAEDLGVSQFVKWPTIAGAEFHGIEEINEEYQKSMIAILPYTKGTAGHQIGVAMANGLPIIATKKAGIFDYLNDNGIYVQENSPGEIAQAIELLMNNEGLRKELGGRARERASKMLSWDVIAQRTYKIYEAMINDV